MRLVIAAAAALMLFGATPAVAEVSEHCKQNGYCLFSGAKFDGAKVAAKPRPNCQTAQSVGMDAIRSAAHGYGDDQLLTLYSDTACANEIGSVTTEMSGVVARSFRITLLPS